MSDILAFLDLLKDKQVPVILIFLGGIFVLAPFMPKYFKIPPKYRKWFWIFSGIFIVLAVIIFIVPRQGGGDIGGIQPNPISQVTRPAKSAYSFETGAMGWVAQTYKDSQACIRVEWSTEAYYDGNHSLKCIMELIGGDDHNSKGEIWIDISKKPLVGMNNRTVTAYILAPSGSSGVLTDPNGFQLFVKDSSWKAEYGPWTPVIEGEWVSISLVVSPTEPTGGYMEPGFDPNKIFAIGVKMGAGGGSMARFNGNIYIDAVDWK
jgi:hypothetical protein